MYILVDIGTREKEEWPVFSPTCLQSSSDQAAVARPQVALQVEARTKETAQTDPQTTSAGLALESRILAFLCVEEEESEKGGKKPRIIKKKRWEKMKTTQRNF